MLRYMYVFVRTFSLFCLPVFRNFRNFIYRKQFRAENLVVGDRVYIVKPHESNSSVTFGEAVEVGKDVYIDYSGGVIVGDFVSISEGVKIYTHNHSVDGCVDWRANPIKFSGLLIGNHCWVGAGAIITERVKSIGEGAVIGAGSVVTTDVPPCSVVAGNPAKLIKMREISGV